MALTTNIVAYWKLDESSGNAADSVNGNTLTNTSVTYSAGVIGNGANFVRATPSSLIITSASQTSLNFTSDFSATFWAKMTSNLNAFYTVIRNCTGATSGANMRWEIALLPSSGGNHLWQLTTSDGSTSTTNTKSIAGAYGTGTFHFCSFVWTAASHTWTIYEDGVSVGTLTTDPATSINSSAKDFRVGIGEAGQGNDWDGELDEIGVWSRVLTSGEITSLYNGGAGFQYPFVAPGPTNVKTWDAVTQSTGIKTYEGVVLASTKTVIGVA